jgi:hypothetical protein
MKDIIKLYEIVENKTLKNLPLLNFERKNKEEELLLQIKEGYFQSDAEAAAKMYGTDDKDVRYKSLKYRLKQKLLNHLYFIDLEKIRVKFHWKNELLLWENFLKARILMEEGYAKMGEKMLRKALLQAEENAFTNIAYLIANLLIDYYVKEQNFPAYRQMQSLIERLREQQKIEEEAQDAYRLAMATLGKSYFSRTHFMEEARGIAASLRGIWEQTGNYNVFELYYRLQVAIYSYKGEYESMLEFLKEVDAIQSQYTIFSSRFDLWHHRTLELEACLHVFRIEEGLSLAKRYAPLFPSASESWFDFHAVYFRLACFAGNYQEAERLIYAAFNNEYMQQLPQESKRMWELMVAYLAYITNDKRLQHLFDVETYYKRLPDYDRHQLTFHLPLLILQIAYAVRVQDYEAVQERVALLQKYTNQNLRANISPRTRLFFRALKIMLDNDFKQKSSRSKGRYTQKQLSEWQSKLEGDYFGEWEIIPYQELWNAMTMDLVREPMQKRGRPKKKQAEK